MVTNAFRVFIVFFVVARVFWVIAGVLLCCF